MRFASAIAFLSVLLLTSGQAVAAPASAKPHPPFALSDVGFTRDCQPNDALVRLLGIVGGGKTEPGTFDEPLYNAVSGDTQQKVSLDEPADWHGLKLRAVSLFAGIERGPANYTLHFADGPTAVIKQWNAMGWRLPTIDQTRPVDDDGYASIGVRAEGGGASVTCWRD